MNWPVKKLGNFIEIVMGQAPHSDQCNKEGEGVVFVKAGEFGIESPVIREWTTDPLKMAKPDDTLICVVGATAGKINRSRFECAIGRSVAAVRTRTNEVEQNYLHAFLSTKVIELRNRSQGAAQAVITREMLQDIEIPIPTLAEQQRIAAVLDTADRILKQRESAIAKLDQLAQSVFLNELQLCDSSSFQLADVAEMYQPKTISANELIENGEYVVYGANGVIGRYDKFNHADSEVLVTCRGATCGTVNWSQPLAWITGNAMVVKPLNNTVTKDFLHYYFKFIADFSSVITGAAQPQITRQTLSRLPIVIPKLENQNEITNVVRKIYKNHDLMNSSKNKLHELTRTLQHQSFAVN
jgi:type I restriction enzyme S subunit